MIIFKKGVDVSGITKECIQGMFEVARYWGADITITSVCDGNHKEGSKHYEGNAFDLRTWDPDKPIGTQLPSEVKIRLMTKLTEVLGVDYDVVVEPTHLHIEYDPVNKGWK